MIVNAAKQVHLIDFGLSLLVSRESSGRPKGSGALQGTVPYVAPEQTGRVNRTIDFRADLYSFGVMLYEMLCNRLPFAHQDPNVLVYEPNRAASTSLHTCWAILFADI